MLIFHFGLIILSLNRNPILTSFALLIPGFFLFSLLFFSLNYQIIKIFYLLIDNRHHHRHHSRHKHEEREVFIPQEDLQIDENLDEFLQDDLTSKFIFIYNLYYFRINYYYEYEKMYYFFVIVNIPRF